MPVHRKTMYKTPSGSEITEIHLDASPSDLGVIRPGELRVSRGHLAREIPELDGDTDSCNFSLFTHAPADFDGC